MVWCVLTGYKLSQFDAVFEAWHDFLHKPPPLNSAMHFLSFNPPGSSEPIVVLMGVFLGDPKEGEELYKPFFKVAGGPFMNNMKAMTFLQIQDILTKDFCAPVGHYWASHNIKVQLCFF